MVMGKDAVIILSGGMDSTTMLYEFHDEIALAITFDYGSLQNKREQKFADMHCKKLGIKHIIIPLEFMGKYFKSSLLMSPDDIPEGRYDDENMRSTVVPFRNGIMLAVACGMAESNGLKRVMMANHAGDHAIYPDCRPARKMAPCCSCFLPLLLPLGFLTRVLYRNCNIPPMRPLYHKDNT